jgi:hypothetical protein
VENAPGVGAKDGVILRECFFGHWFAG